MKITKVDIIFVLICILLYKMGIKMFKLFYHEQSKVSNSSSNYVGQDMKFQLSYTHVNTFEKNCFDYLSEKDGRKNYKSKSPSSMHPIFRAMAMSQCILRNCTSNTLCATKDNVKHFPKPTYLPMTASPCFYISHNEQDGLYLSEPMKNPDNGNELACLPAVYVMGFAKCGSTDLHYRLLQHPRIHGGEMKELRFWYGSIPWFGWEKFYSSENKTLYNLWTYTQMYKNATSFIKENLTESRKGRSTKIPDLLLDSDITMYRPEAVAGISHLVPDAKIIIIMRDPVEREFSFYRFLHPSNHQYNYRYRFENTPKGFHQFVLHELQQDIPFAERQIQFMKEKYQSACYVNYVKNILQNFKSNNILFLHFESYIKHPQFTMESEVLPFLNLVRNNILTTSKDLPKKSYKHYSMLDRTRTLLQDHFRLCNKQLSDLLANERWTWNY